MNRTGNTTACPLAWAVLAWHQRRSSTSPRNSSGVFLMHSLRRYTQQLRSNYDISVYDISISSFFYSYFSYFTFQFQTFCFCPNPEHRSEPNTESLKYSGMLTFICNRVKNQVLTHCLPQRESELTQPLPLFTIHSMGQHSCAALITKHFLL